MFTLILWMSVKEKRKASTAGQSSLTPHEWKRHLTVSLTPKICHTLVALACFIKHIWPCYKLKASSSWSDGKDTLKVRLIDGLIVFVWWFDLICLCSLARMDRIRAMRWQHRNLPDAFKENLNPAEQQVNLLDSNRDTPYEYPFSFCCSQQTHALSQF